MKRLFVSVLALMLCTLPAMAESNETPGVDVTLYGNVTTGYEWTYTVEDEAVLKVAGSGYTTMDGDAQVDGMGGMYQFRLEGLQAGNTVVTFKYARPWETDVPALCTAYYNVRVDEQKNVVIFGMELDPGIY